MESETAILGVFQSCPEGGFGMCDGRPVIVPGGTNLEALKQVNYHLDRAMEAAKLLHGDSAKELRSKILLANLQATNI